MGLSKKKKTNLFRFLHYVWPYWPLLAIGSLCGIAKFCFPLLTNYAIQVITDTALFPAGTNHGIGWLEWLPFLDEPEEWTTATRTHFLMVLLGTLALVYVTLEGPATYLRTYLTGKAVHRSIFKLRFDLYRHIQRLSHRFFDTRQTGGIVSRMTSDVMLAQNLIGQAGTALWMHLISLCIYTVTLFIQNVPLALWTIAVLPLYILNIIKFKGPIKDTSRAVQESLESISGDLHERIGGISIVKSFTREKKEEKKFFGDTRRLFDLTMHNVKLSATFQTTTQVILTVAPLVVLFVGARMVIHNIGPGGQVLDPNGMTTGKLFYFILTLGAFYGPLNQLTNMNVVFANSLAAIDRIFEVFDTVPDVAEAPNPYVPATFRGEVEFRGVTFGYVANRPVISGLNAVIQPGEVIAMVGPSGSGKSTLTKLICRFYDPLEGQVLIDGVDAREWKLSALRGSIGMVMQETIIFSGTVRENLRYGNPNASNEEIIEAARMANAHDFINELEDSYHTIVGENGCQLSGGQRQRLSIARAFLNDPRILILDEATAALDPHSEAQVQDALARLMKGRTTFIIAHRLATVVNATRLLVFDRGRLVEQGSHTELLRQGGLYADLYHQQMSAMTAGAAMV